ncbi:MAG: hypothetical protein BKP49_06775 [Treponema sp. CETP13]|nr:MAG: hypothetical protein BKP49_06775 [Treponema sp. CETP13]
MPKKTKKKSPAGKILGSIVALIIIFFGVGSLMYFTKNFPEFNNKIDLIFTTINNDLSNSNNISKNHEIIPIEKDTKLILPSIFTQQPVFSGLLLGEVDFTSDESITANKNAQEEWKIRNFEYVSDYVQVTNISQGEDCFIFIDSEPALVCIEKQTGEVKRTVCPVFPGTKGWLKDTDYVFVGRDSLQYVFSFDAINSKLDTVATTEKNISINEEKPLSFYLEKIALDKKSEVAVLDGLRNWASYDENASLPTLQFIDATKIDTLYPIKSNDIQYDLKTPSLFVFSPLKQGLYKIGLSDDAGTWLRTRAYVAIYTKGELSLVSLDYDSDRPQVQLQLSNNQLYYIAAGNFSERESLINSQEDRPQLFLKIMAVQ